ncbi:PEP/pyruvate-binding domain-containing protein [Lentzea aerocolonigenes]|uniref:PEP/pyruvate-binding domain-containing protein n=1 Tax=Lentzea aerocolonigenes TaxID=68170 RepID=UPI0004C36C96|nr:PEP/pyruvate-binding domain-containing protein [Lentzea aerocolonigenes]MCP2243050.1 Pyruvate phosphate dikinase, PEP/pyruvate binding domain [Lentzea aerocolonigenes]
MAVQEADVAGLVGEPLTMSAFNQLSGSLGGYSFVKVVVDRHNETIHFLNNARHEFHALYIGTEILGIGEDEVRARIDELNQSFYHASDRRFFLGILSLHQREDKRMFSLETVEVDTMSVDMIEFFYAEVSKNVDAAVPLFFKPANHLQEQAVAELPSERLPRILAHELFSTAEFVALNPGTTKGRLRAFRTEQEYRESTLEWFDIVVMHRVPDDIPRLAGIINASHTTPLSHTNVLATGWSIPNAIQIGAFDLIDRESLDGRWVEYEVSAKGAEVGLRLIDEPDDIGRRPAWYAQRVTLEEPEDTYNPIVDLGRIRYNDSHRYGTKAANLGELHHVLASESPRRLLGFFSVPRPPRDNLLPYLAKLLGEEDDLLAAAQQLLAQRVRVPRGIALPFSMHQGFLESSPKIQQAIGKLKMALELNAREIEPLCVELQQLIRKTRVPDYLLSELDTALVENLAGVRTFVVRSSSNAEDLAGFSAAGIYESYNHVTSAEKIVESVKDVWASLVSARSVRLRQQAGISLDDCFMGVVIQEQVKADFGGVMVTTNPMNRNDFRNVYINVSPNVTDVVEGSRQPMQFLYSTVEGGGRTVSLGDATKDLDVHGHAQLQRLAIVGRLLQSHFSPDYTFDSPVDIEWLATDEVLYVLQLRPYAI